MRRRRVVDQAEAEPVDDRSVAGWWKPWMVLLVLLAAAAVGAVLWFVLHDSGGNKTTMPDVVGMQQDAAVQRVHDANLKPNVEPKQSDRSAGTVVSQDPGAGTQVNEGEEVVLGVS